VANELKDDIRLQTPERIAEIRTKAQGWDDASKWRVVDQLLDHIAITEERAKFGVEKLQAVIAVEDQVVCCGGALDIATALSRDALDELGEEYE